MSMAEDRDAQRIAAEAADWVTRHATPDRAALQQEAFETWLAADPRHQAAYERVSCAWTDIGNLRHLRPDAEQPSRLRAFANGILRPPVLTGAAAACAALVIAVIFAPSLMPRPAPQFATQIAQIEPVHLEDGSIVTLGAQSAIDADFSDASRRQVTLRSGQAFFEIAHNTDRPFYVLAGDVSVRVVGTKFDVRQGPEQTIISVREGVVQVAAGDETPRTLRAGDQAIIQHRTTFFVTHAVSTEVAAVAPQNVAAWRDGRLSYDDTPLSELVADINRYYAPGVDLASADAGDVRITTSFRTDEIEGFLDDLSRAFPVAATRRPDGHYRISATANAS